MPARSSSPPRSIVLAGGGHSHALVLRRWAMQPRKRPSGLITLVNRHSTALYSGMVPGLIAGQFSHDDVAIDLRQLADQAGVALVVAEITGLDLKQRLLILADRPALPFDLLSLDVGAISRNAGPAHHPAIKPLEPALRALQAQDAADAADAQPFRITGAGLAGVEVAFALRQRWPRRPLQLAAHADQPHPQLQRALRQARIERLVAPGPAGDGPGLRCTGSRAPRWLQQAGLPVDGQGRVHTDQHLQVIGHGDLFASGDCAVIRHSPRPPSGVWAVRAAAPLARNLEAIGAGAPLTRWRPQRWALQLLGGADRHGHPTAWALWGPWLLGPHPLLWHWKRRIDRRFMARFRPRTMHTEGTRAPAMLCRGCAAKLPAAPLEAALSAAGLAPLGRAPEDAVPLEADSRQDGCSRLQSVDGFPALVSDPWLNGRLSALHASSDLWACGAAVQSAQAVITLPRTHQRVQERLLSQTLAGIRSALEDQGAALIGGHTLEARDAPPSADSLALGLQVVLTVNSAPVARLWPKRGLQAGDVLLLSRALGTGVLFAAAMAGASRPGDLDQALTQMACSQHTVMKRLRHLESAHPGQLHAATDITGFGLLGHLGEMLGADRADAQRLQLQLQLEAEAIPALPGALALLESGHHSSLAPANRRAWALLDPTANGPSAVALHLGAIPPQSSRHQALLELLVDPQTCGPLLLSVEPSLAETLLGDPSASWQRIGRVMPR